MPMSSLGRNKRPLWPSAPLVAMSFSTINPPPSRSASSSRRTTRWSSQESAVARSTFRPDHHDGLEQRQSSGHRCGWQSYLRDVLDRLRSSTVRHEWSAAKLETVGNETRQTRIVRREHREWSVKPSFSNRTPSRSVRSSARNIWACGRWVIRRTTLRRPGPINCSPWSSKTNTETSSITNGNEAQSVLLFTRLSQVRRWIHHDRIQCWLLHRHLYLSQGDRWSEWRTEFFSRWSRRSNLLGTAQNTRSQRTLIEYRSVHRLEPRRELWQRRSEDSRGVRSVRDRLDHQHRRRQWQSLGHR